MKVFLNLVLLSLFFVGCTTKEVNTPQKEESLKETKQEVNTPEKKESEKVTKVKKEKAKSSDEDSKMIIGELEYVYLPSSKLRLKARIDTGATSTSINALNIKVYERDGKDWVKYNLVDENKKLHPRKAPLLKKIKVKRHGAKYQIRPVVKMRINLGETSQVIAVSLTDRSKFTYPVLIGRNFLNGVAIVDSSKKYTAEPIKDIK